MTVTENMDAVIFTEVDVDVTVEAELAMSVEAKVEELVC